MKNEQGFSLVELLIVVAIIAIIAAIAVPSLLTARMAANEAAGIEACRTIGSAEIAFAAAQNQQFAKLADLYSGNFVDSRFTGDGVVVGGYQFNEDQTITDPDASGDLATVGGATPTMFGILATHQTGLSRWDYSIGADQVVRWGPTAPTGYAEGSPIGKAASGS